MTTVYGLGSGLEVGANVFGVATNYQPLRLKSNGTDDAAPYFPSLLLSAQKMFDWNEQYHVSVGTQVGFNVLLSPGVTKLLNFTYLNFVYGTHSTIERVVLGVYYANQGYRGSEGLGYMIGVEWPIVERKFHLLADYISGQNPISVAVLGGCYYLTPTTLLSLGYQPALNGNDSAVVFELTLAD